jgi:flagellum-specific ATP synthase
MSFAGDVTAKTTEAEALADTHTHMLGDPLARLAGILGELDRTTDILRRGGRVVEASQTVASVIGLTRHVTPGALVAFPNDILGKVIEVSAEKVRVGFSDATTGVSLHDEVWQRDALMLRPDPRWRGRIIDALGRPRDGAGELPRGANSRPIEGKPGEPMKLNRVIDKLVTGVRAIDLFTPICAGQRIGIFAGSGVGKTTLLGMLLRSDAFDTVVLNLVGERGREAREFLEDVLGERASRTVTVMATSSEDALIRKLSVKSAITVAESFRDLGHRVLLVVDSITRFAHAARELALVAGEPPVARGYTPSVLAEIPALLERAGPAAEGDGSITAAFSVLVDGDDTNEPIADTIRGVLDGHIVLDRDIAESGRLPAINVLTSLSRMADKCWSPDEAKLIRQLKRYIAAYEDSRDLRLAGAYRPGGDPDLDQAVSLVPAIYDALKQLPSEPRSTDAFMDLKEMLAGSQQTG